MKRTAVFLLALALAAGMTGCTGLVIPGGCIGGCYILSIASTSGGDVTTPGEGSFSCADGEVVNLVANPEAGYEFVNWTGDVGTIADANDASTTITASASYSIRANFSGNSTPPAGVDYTAEEAEQMIIVLINAERESQNLTALSEDSLLTDLARDHSAYMAENDILTHDRFPGERPLSYNMTPGDARGENLAKIPTQQTVPGPYLSLQGVCEWAVSGWMDSEGHRDIILQPIFTETGVGVSFSEEGLFTYLYITQIFEGDYYG